MSYWDDQITNREARILGKEAAGQARARAKRLLMEKAKLVTYCRMTCLGGSDVGECPCKGPAQCELQKHPNYKHARNEAIARMNRWLLNELKVNKDESK